jgi:hypothetical protein
MNYKQVLEAMESLENFNHNGTMSAVRDNEGYKVFSYNTEIARYVWDLGLWKLNPNKYSVTTSKQQTYVKRAIASRNDQFELGVI